MGKRLRKGKVGNSVYEVAGSAEQDQIATSIAKVWFPKMQTLFHLRALLPKFTRTSGL